MSQFVEKIYLHWSATDYDWAVSGHYHTVITGDGIVKRLTGYGQSMRTHTYARNSNSISLCCACMGGTVWQDYPPTDRQINSMCQEVASISLDLGWSPGDITVKRVLTHAEAASNRDFKLEQASLATGVSFDQARRYGLPHDNYGPSSWHDGWPGGTSERWDFWQLKESDPGGVGGDLLREKIKECMRSPETDDIKIPSLETDNKCKIYWQNNLVATGLLLPDDRCYVRLLDITPVFDIRWKLGKKRNEIDLFSQHYTPHYLTDAPIIASLPTVDIFLNRPVDANNNAVVDEEYPVRPFMRGAIINQSTHVILADFCWEIGLSLKHDSDRKRIDLYPGKRQ